MSVPVRRTRIWLGGLAFSGVVAAHVIAYGLVAPDPHQRAELLEATGHVYWPAFVALGLGLFVASLAGVVVRAARAKDGPTSGALAATFVRLAAMQVFGFTVLELLERALHGTFSPESALEPVFVIGLVLQVVVAFAGALMLVLVRRAIGRLVGVRAPATRSTNSFEPGTVILPARFRPATGSRTLRGPPTALPANS